MADQAPTTTGMIEGGSPTIFVSDFDRAVRFYTQTLGFGVMYRAGNEFAMIDAGGGLTLGLHPPSDSAARPGTSGAIQIGLNVTTPIEQVVATLKERGVAFRGPVKDDGSVKLAFFGDPDGNDLYLCEVARR